jgi:RNA polymerase sigma-70 factor, ECF subfamily
MSLLSAQRQFALVDQSNSDEDIVARVVAGDIASFEILMRRHNTRLYRIGRAILRNEADAEDLMQEAYIRAYQNLSKFEGRAKFSTWLSRIAVNEALARKRSLARREEIEPMVDPQSERAKNFPERGASPEQQASAGEMRGLLEEAIDSLPEQYRTVIMLRDIQEMETTETAEALDISEQNVKTRLHRARALLRKRLYLRAGEQKAEAYPFHAVRCDRVVASVFAVIWPDRKL